MFLVNHLVSYWVCVRVLAVIRGDNLLPHIRLLLPILLMIVRPRPSVLCLRLFVYQLCVKGV